MRKIIQIKHYSNQNYFQFKNSRPKKLETNIKFLSSRHKNQFVLKDLTQKIRFSTCVTYFSSFGVPSEEVEGERFAQVEVEGLENKALHAPDICLSVGIVCNVDEVCNFGGVHLLVFRGEKHTGDTHQL